MQRLLIVVALAAIAACTPPAAEAPAEDAPAAEAPAVDMGPYSNSWDSAEFSRFEHTLHAPAAGDYQLELRAVTNSPGGETVAVYPIGEDGEPRTDRIMFVIASLGGQTETRTVTIPEGGLPVSVAVENASGRPFAGDYTLTLTPVP